MKKLAPLAVDKLLGLLRARFEQNTKRHPGMDWSKLEGRLRDKPERLWTLNEMEKTGGEPDVVALDKDTGEYIFFDCAPESPVGRRNVCYDQEALAGRKKFKPLDSAVNMATVMGIELLTAEDYRFLQGLGEFDSKTSSWLKTPPAIRKLGGAIFADRRYDTVFVYHNGADSYYGVRGFRGLVRV